LGTFFTLRQVLELLAFRPSQGFSFSTLECDYLLNLATNKNEQDKLFAGVIYESPFFIYKT